MSSDDTGAFWDVRDIRCCGETNATMWERVDRYKDGSPLLLAARQRPTCSAQQLGGQGVAEGQLNISWSAAQQAARTALEGLGFAPDRLPTHDWQVVARGVVGSMVGRRVFIALREGLTQDTTDVTVRIVWAPDVETATENAETIFDALAREAQNREAFDFRSAPSLVQPPAATRGAELLAEANPISMLIPSAPPRRSACPSLGASGYTVPTREAFFPSSSSSSAHGPVFAPPPHV